MTSAEFWQRHQRILRLQREHDRELNDQGLALMRRLVVTTFDDFADVAREASPAFGGSAK